LQPHIDNVRLMWLAAADKWAKIRGKLRLSDGFAGRSVGSAPETARSGCKICGKNLQNADGQVPNFKPDVLAFGGYLIAHDSHRRGQISVLAHQMDMPAPSKASYGPWEWGTLWKECER
jgi:hypothetical protein